MRSLQTLLLLSIFSATFAFESTAQALTCTNDVDCPEPACGGQVCQWGAAHTCVPAGTDAVGTDGWCTVDSDCKCFSLGAKCSGVHCTFTKPPADGGTSDATSSDGAATDAVSTDSASDTPAATDSGSKADALPPADTGSKTDTGTSAADTGTAAADTGTVAAAPAGDSGGCAMGAVGAEGSAFALGLAALGLVRRRRAR